MDQHLAFLITQAEHIESRVYRIQYPEIQYPSLVPVDRSVATQDVATTAGIKGTNRDANGVVFKLNAAYSGYTRKTLWEWLSDVEGS